MGVSVLPERWKKKKEQGVSDNERNWGRAKRRFGLQKTQSKLQVTKRDQIKNGGAIARGEGYVENQKGQGGSSNK